MQPDKIFPDEYLPNAEGAAYHSKWVTANPGEATKWAAFRDAVVAGGDPAPPSMATKYGRALVAAGKLHMSVTDIGSPPIGEAATFNIPHWSTTLNAGSFVQRWRRYTTPSTPDLHPHTGQVALIATPAATHPVITRKSWVWWFCVSVVVPTNWPSLLSDSVSFSDWHTTSIDNGLGWNWGSGVAPVHIYYDDGDSQLRFQHEYNSPNHVFNIVTGVTKGQRYDIVGHMILGRLDQQLGLNGPGVPGGGIGTHPNNGFGRTRIWVNGTQALDTGNISNLQRATNPSNGLTYTMTIFERSWDGLYQAETVPQNATIENYATRVGTTFQEAMADGSEGFTLLVEEQAAGSGSSQVLAPLSSADFVAPTNP